MDQERGVLFGLLAMVHRQIDPGQLMTAASASQGGDFAAQLISAGVLTPADQAALEQMVDTHIEQHGSIGKAIDSLGAGPGLLKELRVSLGAPSPEDSLFASLAESPVSTRAGGLGTVKPGEAATGEAVPAVKEHEGRYEELRVFGQGGMGRILLVHDDHLGRDVALKQLLPEAVGKVTRSGAPTTAMLTVPIIARFLQEARVTGQLEHPSIVPVYELGYRNDGSLYYTMKLVRGKSLQEALQQAKTLRERLPLLNHFLDLCYAISYAHTRGVIHRDLKPLNVMIGEFGETIVIDWGIAKVRGAQDIHAKDLQETVHVLRVGDAESTTKTVYGQTIGSPYFMPPEQAAGDTNAIDERSDVYALGAVLYHILTGKPPYAGTTVKQFMERVGNFPPKPVRELEPEAPAELAAVCERALARKPADRYQSTKDLTEEIKRYLSGGLVSAYEYRFGELFKRFVKKHRRVLTTAAAGLVALIVVGVYSYIRVSEERDNAIAQERIAQEERGKAIDARDEAETARVEAVAARVEAEDARTQAEIARDDARRELYFAKVALTPRALAEQQLSQARNLLAECPEEYRDWEWGHLMHESNADLMTLPGGGRYAAFTPDGKALVTGSANGTVAVMDRASGAVARTLAEKSGFGYAMAFSADGGRAAVSADEAVWVWDTGTGAELFKFAEPTATGQQHEVAMSADGARVAAMDSDRKVRVWQLGASAPLLELPIGQRGAGLALAPGGARLLLLNSEFGDAGWERTFEVFSVADGKRLGRGVLKDPLSAHAAAFDGSGKRLALATDNGLQLWDVEAWKLVHEFPGIYAHPDTVAFAGGGAWLASGTKEGDLAVWDTASGKGAQIAKAHSSAIRMLTFAPDGAALATVSEDRTVKLWSVPELRLLEVLKGHNRSVFAAAFSPDGAELATGSFDGATKIWDAQCDLAHAQVRLMACAPESGVLAGAIEGAVALWDMHTGHRTAVLPGIAGNVEAIAFDTAGWALAVIANDAGKATARIYEVAAQKETTAFPCAVGARMARLEPGGKRLYLFAQSTLSIHDTAQPGTPVEIKNASGFALSGDGASYAVAATPESNAKTRAITVYAGDCSVKGAFSVDTEYVASLAFSPDGGTLVVGCQTRSGDTAQGAVHVWDVAAAKETALLEGHGAQVSCFAFSADGAHLATGGRDSKAILWDLAASRQLCTFEGHANNIIDLAFNPAGSRLVTASQDGTFKIWSAKDGREILTLQSSALAAEGQVVTPSFVGFSADELALAALTAPEALAPRVLWAFPHKLSAYPGSPEESLEARAEAYKRTAATGN